jgi:hypothetical protein
LHGGGKQIFSHRQIRGYVSLFPISAEIGCQTFRRVAVAVKEVNFFFPSEYEKKYEPFDNFQDIPPRNPRNELTS